MQNKALANFKKNVTFFVMGKIKTKVQKCFRFWFWEEIFSVLFGFLGVYMIPANHRGPYLPDTQRHALPSKRKQQQENIGSFSSSQRHLATRKFRLIRHCSRVPCVAKWIRRMSVSAHICVGPFPWLEHPSRAPWSYSRLFQFVNRQLTTFNTLIDRYSWWAGLGFSTFIFDVRNILWICT